jgi:hypothetical protein
MLGPMRHSWLVSWVVLVACAVEEPRDPVDFGESEGDSACIPGEQRACACPAGAPDGVQVCADAGDRFEACTGCPSDSGSDGGTLDGSTGAPASSSGEDTGPGPVTNDGSSSGGGGPPIEGPPDEYDVVEQVALEFPALLTGSCVETGGNNEFLFEVVRRLRMIDPRWGMNWKRGVIGDLSQDVVDYHWGDGEPEESTDVFIIDIIVGHCGDTPQAGWIDVTQATLDAGTVGMWTLAGQDL